MADNLNIIRSKVVSSDYDVFWQQSNTVSDTQKTTLIISTPYQPGSSEESQLQKMLQACTLSPEHYQVVQVSAEQQLAWHQLRDTFRPESVIVLGVNPQQLGISALLRFNEPNRFNDCIFIASLSLPELEKQPEAKKQLWLNALKPVFVDKSFKDRR